MTGHFDTFGPPPPKPDPFDAAAATGTVDEEPALDAREAAALLARTTAEAERRFALQPPVLVLAAAATALVAYGAVWLSVRDQHPYSGPSAPALAVLYGTLAVWIVFVTGVTRRALRGRSSRQRRLDGIVFGAIWICVYVLQGALHHVGASHAIAYGVYPAVAPLVVVGSAAAGYEAARAHPARALLAAAVVALGSFASFAGPADVWAVVGAGLCGLLLAVAAVQLWRRRARA
ncbi:MAG TPA: hypothetical protein VFL60_03345 [Gaiellaceae bacterium]|nr:hypothetical protein [Gaiellaceae bacterium]